jgi:hypothetical protein
MGIVAGATNVPVLGLVGWLGVVGVAYGAARYTFQHLANARREKLHELANEISKQIAESLASEPADPKRRLGR